MSTVKGRMRGRNVVRGDMAIRTAPDHAEELPPGYKPGGRAHRSGILVEVDEAADHLCHSSEDRQEVEADIEPEEKAGNPDAP